MTVIRRFSERCLRLLSPLVPFLCYSWRRLGFLVAVTALLACSTPDVSPPSATPTRLLIDIRDSDDTVVVQTECVFDPGDQICRFSTPIPDFRLYQRSVSGEVGRGSPETTTLAVRLFRFDDALFHQSSCTITPQSGSDYGTCRLSAVVEASSPLHPEGDAPRRFTFILTPIP